MGENICKRSNRQGINFQNIPTARVVLGQKKQKQKQKKQATQSKNAWKA